MNTRFRTVTALVSLLALTLVLAACGSSSSSSTKSESDGDKEATSTKASSDTKVSDTTTATVKEMSISFDKKSVKAGDVKVIVKNEGKVMHEVVFLKTDVPVDKLTVKDGRVSEKDSVGEVADVEAGETKDGVIKLEPGTYAVVCNIAGHYPAGMYTTLKVV